MIEKSQCFNDLLEEDEMIDEKLIQEYNENIGDNAPKNLGCTYCIYSSNMRITFFCVDEWECTKSPKVTYDSISGHKIHYPKCSTQNKNGQCEFFKLKPKCVKCDSYTKSVSSDGLCDCCKQDEQSAKRTIGFLNWLKSRRR